MQLVGVNTVSWRKHSVAYVLAGRGERPRNDPGRPARWQIGTVFFLMGLGEIRSLFIFRMPYSLCSTETYGRNCGTASPLLTPVGRITVPWPLSDERTVVWRASLCAVSVVHRSTVEYSVSCRSSSAASSGRLQVSVQLRHIASVIYFVLGSSWNVMAHGDARVGKWRGNWRMEWVASTLHYLGTWCIQHYYRWCAHLGCQ